MLKYDNVSRFSIRTVQTHFFILNNCYQISAFVLCLPRLKYHTQNSSYSRLKITSPDLPSMYMHFIDYAPRSTISNFLGVRKRNFRDTSYLIWVQFVMEYKSSVAKTRSHIDINEKP